MQASDDLSRASSALAEVPDRLLADSAALVRERAIRAARALMVEHGLDVSMERIAEASGLGRRTLFRHFESRDALIGAALEAGFDSYERRQLEALEHAGPLGPMLRETIRRVHQTHIESGRGLWQLACAFDDDLPPAFLAANRKRRVMRHRLTGRMADRAWALAGGSAPTPEAVRESFTLVMSSFTTHSMLIDRDNGAGAAAEASGPRAAARFAAFVEHGARLLEAVIDAERQRAASASSATPLPPQENRT